MCVLQCACVILCVCVSACYFFNAPDVVTVYVIQCGCVILCVCVSTMYFINAPDVVTLATGLLSGFFSLIIACVVFLLPYSLYVQQHTCYKHTHTQTHAHTHAHAHTGWQPIGPVRGDPSNWRAVIDAAARATHTVLMRTSYNVVLGPKPGLLLHALQVCWIMCVLCVCVRVCNSVCMFLCMHECDCVCTCVCVRVCVCV